MSPTPARPRPGRIAEAGTTLLALIGLAEAGCRIALRQDPRRYPGRRWPGLRLPAPDRLARGTDRWLRWSGYPRPCRPRSLALFLWLRRAGTPVTLHFGVRRATGSGPAPFEGHAWLSLHGAPFLEPGPPPATLYTETLRIPAAAETPHGH